MKKYIAPKYWLEKFATEDIMSFSSIINNGDNSYTDEEGETVSGKEGSFVTWLDDIK